MTFYADLHVHSRFSRATSQDCTLPQIAAWARRKGIGVVGTGDFTHPEWLAEIREQLVPAERGLFRLRPDLEEQVERHLPPGCRPTELSLPDGRTLATGPTRFALQVEISTIYKKGDRTRKVHHLILVPDLERADRLVDALARIGNLKSDGRPILGLDSRNLLEIVLEAGDGCFLIPAHIWTPWFSALGSKSGFDTIAECYGDLADHIFAAETGLSSDPAMNWRLSSLDRYRLVSNSDAHSPSKLGREACVFHTDVDYFAIRDALATGDRYGGTVEFFPEEGKYHLDGHRKCETRMEPEETRKNRGICPVCGKPVTVGVMNRVAELADRPEGARPPGAAPYRSFIPLAEVLSELLGVGPGSGKVESAYDELAARVGPELYLLEHASEETLERAGAARLAEAISRMRRGTVIRDAGYDGEYGAIRVFAPDELKRDSLSPVLFDVPPDPAARPEPKPSRPPVAAAAEQAAGIGDESPAAQQVRDHRPQYGCDGLLGIVDALDPDQRRAAEIGEGALAIIAGPGTGKTRTLTHRIAHLVSARGIPPEQCLAITFTRRAAAEMADRLQALLPEAATRLTVTTFHALGLAILREHAARLALPSAFRIAGDGERAGLLAGILGVSEVRADRLLNWISTARRTGRTVDGDPEKAKALHAYEDVMRAGSLLDFDDLIIRPADLLEQDAALRSAYHARYRWVSVDEFQDIDAQQYRLLRALVPPDGNLCVIGDPDQSIYGFRGADAGLFEAFGRDFPDARTVELSRNYRSGPMIVEGARQMIAPTSLVKDRKLSPVLVDPTRITIHEAPTDKAEAEFIVKTIEQLVGGSGFFSMDSGRVDSGQGGSFAFCDFAVLYRTELQAEALLEALVRSGMPYQKRSHVTLDDTRLVQLLAAGMSVMPAGCTVVRRLEEAVATLEAEGREAGAKVLAGALRPLAVRCVTMEAFLSELAIGVDVDLWDPRAEGISLRTLHASKGLEFPVVFIPGCEEGILPLRWGTGDDQDVSEERRLFFVGMTRARRRLYLSRARRRLWRGSLRDMPPSAFLRDIEESLLQRAVEERGRVGPKPQQLTLF